jgi:hypothetical protein
MYLFLINIKLVKHRLRRNARLRRPRYAMYLYVHRPLDRTNTAMAARLFRPPAPAPDPPKAADSWTARPRLARRSTFPPSYFSPPDRLFHPFNFSARLLRPPAPTLHPPPAPDPPKAADSWSARPRLARRSTFPPVLLLPARPTFPPDFSYHRRPPVQLCRPTFPTTASCQPSIHPQPPRLTRR